MKMLLGFMAFVVCGGSAPTPFAENAIDTRVLRVIERTKTTRQPYRAYYWNVIKLPDGRVLEEWSAEFNLGSLHRVETPRDRVIADCAAKTGSHLSLVFDTLVSGSEVASVACGIATAKATIGARLLGRVATAFGPADRVEVSDSDLIRSYDISDDGIILRTVYQKNEAGHPVVLVLEPQTIVRTAPSRTMFTQTSLKISFVPDAYLVKQPRS